MKTVLEEIFEESEIPYRVNNRYNISTTGKCECTQCQQRRFNDAVSHEFSTVVDFVSKKAKYFVDKVKRGIDLFQFIRGAVTDMNDLTDRIFYSDNPTLAGKKLSPSELKKWENTRDKIVIPFFSKPDNFSVPNLSQCDLHDLRTKVPKQMKHWKDGYDIVKQERNISDVTSIVLHQMAFGTKTRGNDLKSYYTIAAHYIVLPDGKVGQLRNNTTYLNASNCFNAHGIAIEFAGNFPDSNLKWYPQFKDRSFYARLKSRPGVALSECWPPASLP